MRDKDTESIERQRTLPTAANHNTLQYLHACFASNVMISTSLILVSISKSFLNTFTMFLVFFVLLQSFKDWQTIIPFPCPFSV